MDKCNFTSIQHAQGISTKGYAPLPLRTGYEQVVADRVDSFYAQTAKKKGKVIALNKFAITVEYSDGEKVSVELGRVFGNAAGSSYPNDVVTDLKKGDKVGVGDTIAYNSNFFTPDPFNPKNSLWKGGKLARTALMESVDTFEDSSAVSKSLSQGMASDVTKIRHVFVDFDQTIKNLVKVGDYLEPESILCTIEDALTSNTDVFNDDSIQSLKLLSNNTPKAKYGGKVDKVEILYYGDKGDMSESLKQLADQADKELAKSRRALGKKVITGGLNDSLRIDNKTLEMDTLVIKIYLTKEDLANTGDKLVFANQLKTIIARVLEGTNKSEDGQDIDAFFGYTSIANRVVLSPEIIGTTNTLLKVLSKKVADIYFDDK